MAPRFPPAIGGVEEHVYRISLELAKRGHKITVITSNEFDSEKLLGDEGEANGIRVQRFPLFFPKFFRECWLSPTMLKSYKNFKTDVVHVHGYRCLNSFIALLMARFKGTPKVFTPHGIYPPRSRADALFKKTFDIFLGRLMLKISDRIIALTEHNKRLLLQMGAHEEKISILPNGISLEEFKAIRRKNYKTLKDKYGSPLLLYVGRIDWNKRLEKIVEAMPLILKNFPSAKLMIVGPDYANHADQLKRLGRKLGVDPALIITGAVPREKLLSFYSIADVFILPSLYEGFGISLLEAMMSQVPVVASPFGGPGDILTHRVNAWLLNGEDETEIFEAVNSILSDGNLRETIVQNALKLVKSRYTWEKIVDELELIYIQVVRKKSKGKASF
ncbi:MAG: glycosyltransferase family 4 protein [Candidatus Bathyarchaeia archaeon]